MMRGGMVSQVRSPLPRLFFLIRIHTRFAEKTLPEDLHVFMECNRLACSLQVSRCSASQSNGSTRMLCSFLGGGGASYRREQTAVFAYPRFVADTTIARDSTVMVGAAAMVASDCRRLAGQYLLVPPAPAHAFHFFIEWAFHLFAELHADRSRRSHLLLLPASRGHLDPQKLSLYRALMRRAADGGRLINHLQPLDPVCLDRARIGLSPEVSLVASACRVFRPPSSLPPPSAAEAAELARARTLTNCTLTRHRLLAFAAFVRSSLGIKPPPARQANGHSSPTPRVLLVQRAGAVVLGRTLLGLEAFQRELSLVLRAALGRWVEIIISDFGTDMVANSRMLQGVTAIVAVHGNALTNMLLAPPRALGAAIQLVPSCLPVGTYSAHAYEVLGSLVSRRTRSLSCGCAQPARGKLSHVHCNATRVASALASMLTRGTTTLAAREHHAPTSSSAARDHVRHKLRTHGSTSHGHATHSKR